MVNLYSRLLELLGKRYNDPIFPQFVADLDEQPDGCDWANPILFNEFDTSFNFYKSGFFSLHFKYGVANRIRTLINAAIIMSGEVPPFSDLPAGITLNDRRADVQSKIGLKPFFSSTEGTCDAYYLEPYMLKFWFERGEVLSEFEIQI